MKYIFLSPDEPDRYNVGRFFLAACMYVRGYECTEGYVHGFASEWDAE